jgi:hypothetical protein
MRTILIVAIVLIIVILGLLLYRSHSGSVLQVTPDAREEIEKAKGR